MRGTDIFFMAQHRMGPAVIRRASAADIAGLLDEIPSGSARDILDQWTMIAFDMPGGSTELHAIGWRVELANTWITSPVAAVDLEAGLISTFSRHSYALGSLDELQLAPELREHLLYALCTWGFSDVRE